MSSPADVAALTMRGHSASWAVALTLTGNQITGPVAAGLTAATVTWPAVSETHAIFSAAGEAAAGGDVVSAVLADGVTIEVDKVTRKIEGTTGDDKNTGGGTGGGGDRINWTTLLTGITKTIAEAAMRGKLFMVCVPSPDAVAGTEEGFHFLIGVMTSEVESAGVSETIGSRLLEFTGGKTYTISADARTALMTQLPAVTPISNTDDYVVPPIQPPALLTTDIDELIKGQIVSKAAA